MPAPPIDAVAELPASVGRLRTTSSASTGKSTAATAAAKPTAAAATTARSAGSSKSSASGATRAAAAAAKATAVIAADATVVLEACAESTGAAETLSESSGAAHAEAIARPGLYVLADRAVDLIRVICARGGINSTGAAGSHFGVALSAAQSLQAEIGESVIALRILVRFCPFCCPF